MLQTLAGLKHEDEGPQPYYVGNDAWFMISDVRHTGEGLDFPNNFLRVAINRRSGFGSMIWGVNDNHPITGGVFDHVWVSHNPRPPETDPRVIADPGEPKFHHLNSALPISDVYATVEEFCRQGTGFRPESVKWVRGDLGGSRFEDSP
jgi:hypothetical protein